MTLLREIQNNLSSPGGDITAVLRKCKILAARLGSDEFSRWIDWELNGYPESHRVPDYRRLSITYYGSFMNVAWRVPEAAVPLQLIPEEHRDSFTYVEFREGIVKAESLAKDGATIQRPDLIFLLQGKMYPGMNCQSVWGRISRIEFEQLTSAAKTRILDFSLKLEAENPDAGDGQINSQPIPMEKLQPLVLNTFYGPVGNLAQGSEHFSQAATLGIGTEDLARLIAEFTKHIGELKLEASQRRKAEAQVATLKARLASEPNPVTLREAGRTLRNITEGAIGSLLATATQPGVWHWIQQTMASYF